VNRVLTIAKHELSVTLRRKTWLFMAFVFPVIMVGFAAVIGVLTARGIEQSADIGSAGIVDVANLLPKLPETDFQAKRYASEEAAKEALLADVIEEYFVVPPDYLASGVIRRYSTRRSISAAEVFEEGFLRDLAYENLIPSDVSPQVANRLRSPVNVVSFRLDASGEGKEPINDVVHEADGHADGYAAYRIRERKVVVNKLISATDEAYTALWGYCFGVDLMTGVEARGRPVDDPLPWMLADPRQLKRSVHDQMWLRLVDVMAALSGRGYSEEGRLVIEVKDESCPWNQGRLELEGGRDGAECKATTAAPDLGLRASTLSTAYLGAVPMTTLARAGLVEEYTAGALARADRMLSTSVQPWWPISI